jgi:copper(I)-binding protein
MVNNANFSWSKGTSVNMQLTVTDCSGAAVNLSGTTIEFTAAQGYTTASSIHKAVTEHTIPASGITNIELTGSDTNIDTGTYIHEFQYTDGSGNKYVFLEGQLVIKPKISP